MSGIINLNNNIIIRYLQIIMIIEWSIKNWKSKFIEMMQFPFRVKKRTIEHQNANHTCLTIHSLSLRGDIISKCKTKEFFNQYEIPTDIVYYGTGNKKVLYKYRKDAPRLIFYYKSGTIAYKLWGTFEHDNYDVSVLLKEEKELPHNYKLQSLIVECDYNNNIQYLPAMCFYDKLGNLRYKAYVNEGCKYFSPGGQHLLPARIWYTERGLIEREEYWDNGEYLKEFTFSLKK